MTEDERAAVLTARCVRVGTGRRGDGRGVWPVDDPEGPYGIGILLVEDMRTAELVRDGDPALTSPHGFTTEISPMLSLVTPGGRFDAF